MPSLKDVRTRIESVNSTKQITSAMKMVAASKLRKSQNAVNNMRPYAAKLNEILQNINAGLDQESIGDYGQERDLTRILLVPITSNRGLCGAFNSNIIKETQSLINEDYANQNAAGNVDVLTVGKKATDHFSIKGHKYIGNHDELFNELSFENVFPLAEELMQRFASKEYDRIIIIYNHFKNAATQVVTSEQLLPVNSGEDSGESKLQVDYLFEPGKREIVYELIPAILKVQFYKAMLDSYAAEHGARMLAMSQATDNATELIKELKLQYNKARQAAITGEILEIVGGAEALKNA
ncbi:MAG: ATP synthase F1 subunit gamma [Bacteroidales bacterium]|jgi:F-type H+-transporting ATPase subunit gamma|nr:ATP synthase F1 subunit gamma [Bacteroidales bacterium]